MPGEARLALAALFAGATAIGFAPIFVRLSDLGPVATAFYRLLLALPPLALWLWWERCRPATGPASADRAMPPGLVVAGLFFAADLAVWHWSIRITTVANATLLANFAPVVVTAAGWWLFGERARPRFLVGLLLALLGAVVLMGDSLAFSRDRVLGDVLGLATAVFYAGYLMAVARLRVRLATATVMFWSAAVSAAALLPLALLSGENLWPARAEGWLVLLGLAWISHAAGQSLIAWALRHLTAAFGSVSLLWQPAAAALLAWLLLAEPLGVVQALGGIIVLAGIYLARTARASFEERSQ